MAATGFTPIQIYSSSTGGTTPAAGSLTNNTLGSELAINITDGYLFYKDNANVVQKIGYKLVPIANGGTNQTAFTGKSGNVAGLVFFDGTSLTNDATVTDVGYDTSTNTLTVANISNAGNLSFTGFAKRIYGDFSNATPANRLSFQDSTTNAPTVIQTLPNGTSTTSGLIAFGNSDPTNSVAAQLFATAGTVSLRSAITGTGTYGALTFYTSGAEKARIDTSGNFGIGTNSPLSTTKLDVNGGFFRLRSGTTISADASGNVNALLFESSGGTGEHAMIAGGNASANFLTFYTTNFAAPTEKMRIFSSGGVSIGNTTDPGAANLSVSGSINTAGYTVATLPTAVTGKRVYVTDALAPVFGSAVAGGGAVTVPVFYNGTNWIVG